MSAFASWAPLIDGCGEYARLSGWRFSMEDFLDIETSVHRGGAQMQHARLQALPTVLHWGELVARASQGDEELHGLLQEFQLCQRLVAREAVVNSMLSMCRALGLEDKSGDVDDGEADCAFQDLTQPLEVVARRLFNYRRMLDADASSEMLRERLLQASFIVEFGLAHGLPECSDRTADEMLIDFLERVREWGGNNKEAARIILRELPPGPAHNSLRRTVSEWIEENKGWVIGGAVLGGLGLLAAGAAIAMASRSDRQPAAGTLHAQLGHHGRRPSQR